MNFPFRNNQKKVFNCPANLASHRRWHKPRQSSTSQKNMPSGSLKLRQKPNIRSNENTNNDGQVGNFVCKDCGKAFRRLAINQSQKTHLHNIFIVSSDCTFFFLEWLTSKSMQSFINIRYAKWKKVFWSTTN